MANWLLFALLQTTAKVSRYKRKHPSPYLQTKILMSHLSLIQKIIPRRKGRTQLKEQFISKCISHNAISQMLQWILNNCWCFQQVWEGCGVSSAFSDMMQSPMAGSSLSCHLPQAHLYFMLHPITWALALASLPLHVTVVIHSTTKS